jgi:hypothetical protein
VDFPRSIVHSLLYRNLAGRSAKITTSRIGSSYSVIRGIWHLRACVPSSNTSAIAGRVAGVVECGAAGSRRGSERPRISLRRELRHNEVDGRISLIIDLTLRMSMISSVATAPTNKLGFDLTPLVQDKTWLFRVGKIAHNASLEFGVRGRLIPATNEADIFVAQNPKNEPGALILCDHWRVDGESVKDSLRKPLLPVLAAIIFQKSLFFLVPFNECERPRPGGEEVCTSPCPSKRPRTRPCGGIPPLCSFIPITGSLMTAPCTFMFKAYFVCAFGARCMNVERSAFSCQGGLCQYGIE